jgi:hypothetical protein
VRITNVTQSAVEALVKAVPKEMAAVNLSTSDSDKALVRCPHFLSLLL